MNRVLFLLLLFVSSILVDPANLSPVKSHEPDQPSSITLEKETGSTGRQGRFLFGPASTIHSHLGYVGGDPFAPPPLYYRPISMVMAAIHGIGAAIMDIIGVISRLPPPNVGDGYDPGPGPMYDDDGYDFGGDYDSDYRNLQMPSRPRPPRPRPFSPMDPVQFQVPPPMY